jgi:DNA-directed RNA polymerase specialized sigma24 family protein/ribosome-associated translation inhibitor RaiA
MNVHITYKVHKTPGIEKEINHLIEKLRTRLQVFRPELIHLKGLVEQNSPREGFSICWNLRLPSGQFAAQTSAPSAIGALKLSSDDLLQQLAKHKDMLRGSQKRARRSAPQGRPRGEKPFEKTLASVPLTVACADDVRSWVNVNLQRLNRFVEGEISFRENAGDLQPHSVSKEEVIDEAVARALDDTVSKPDRLGLEAWIYRLALQVLNQLSSPALEGGEDVHLEDAIRTRNPRFVEDPDSWAERANDGTTQECRIADPRVSSPEEVAYLDEIVALVQAALGGTTRASREAFILHTIEGFTLDEICAITDRKLEEVQAAIAEARQHLRNSDPLLPARLARGANSAAVKGSRRLRTAS